MRPLGAETGAALVAQVLNDDYYGEPFSEHLVRRAVLFPMTYILEDDEFDLFAGLARRFGEDELVLYKIECVAGSGQCVAYRWDDRRDYYGHDAAMNAIISPRGRWSLLIYAEGFGLFGADAEAMEVFLDLLPPERQNDERDLVEHLHATESAAHVKYEWLPKLLAYVHRGAGPA